MQKYWSSFLGNWRRLLFACFAVAPWAEGKMEQWFAGQWIGDLAVRVFNLSVGIVWGWMAAHPIGAVVLATCFIVAVSAESARRGTRPKMSSGKVSERDAVTQKDAALKERNAAFDESASLHAKVAELETTIEKLKHEGVEIVNLNQQVEALKLDRAACQLDSLLHIYNCARKTLAGCGKTRQAA